MWDGWLTSERTRLSKCEVQVHGAIYVCGRLRSERRGFGSREETDDHRKKDEVHEIVRTKGHHGRVHPGGPNHTNIYSRLLGYSKYCRGANVQRARWRARDGVVMRSEKLEWGLCYFIRPSACLYGSSRQNLAFLDKLCAVKPTNASFSSGHPVSP